MSTQKEEQIVHMVNRFLQWQLPDDFQPDAGISFNPEFRGWDGKVFKYKPIGTNLLTATQAKAMVKYLLQEMPAQPQKPCDLLHCCHGKLPAGHSTAQPQEPTKRTADEILLAVLRPHPNIQPEDRVFISDPKITEAQKALYTDVNEIIHTCTAKQGQTEIDVQEFRTKLKAYFQQKENKSVVPEWKKGEIPVPDNLDIEKENSDE